MAARTSKHPVRTYVCINTKCPNLNIKVRIPAVVAKTVHRGYDADGKSLGTGTIWRWDDLWCECGDQPFMESDTLSPKKAATR
jgi:hypothetical protein